ncbi:thioredoxin family protein [Sphingobacterium lactis]|uniref:thioredoxin family protein n=1 Tax=Sphingobacterium lactis TaxID=797291 RepID=UPI003F80B4DF
MKKIILGLTILFSISLLTNNLSAQTKSTSTKTEQAKPYHPEADAQKDIDQLIAKAKKEKKNIVIQAGGNWCVWCLRFNDFIHSNQNVSTVIDKNYLYYHLNYSPENENVAVFNKYAPNKGKEFGYPFFIVLNNKGEVLTVRESGNLELGKGYDEAKVLEFFNAWLPKK